MDISLLLILAVLFVVVGFAVVSYYDNEIRRFLERCVVWLRTTYTKFLDWVITWYKECVAWLRTTYKKVTSWMRTTYKKFLDWVITWYKEKGLYGVALLVNWILEVGVAIFCQIVSGARLTNLKIVLAMVNALLASVVIIITGCNWKSKISKGYSLSIKDYVHGLLVFLQICCRIIEILVRVYIDASKDFSVVPVICATLMSSFEVFELEKKYLIYCEKNQTFKVERIPSEISGAIVLMCMPCTLGVCQEIEGVQQEDVRLVISEVNGVRRLIHTTT